MWYQKIKVKAPRSSGITAVAGFILFVDTSLFDTGPAAEVFEGVCTVVVGVGALVGIGCCTRDPPA
jgi:hypothetical protein